ncbi:MAG: hypothetical protein IJI08_10245 [Clostridia bacterium]|nr:hypothetical protein [Clostridia bacterium]
MNMKMKPYCVGYPINKILEEEDAATERLYNAIFGDMDEEELKDYQARRNERFRQQRENALKKARALLRQMNRPVCRRDMLMAMEMAIMHQVKSFETMQTPPEAAELVALVICKNMLMDGPLHEGA